MVFDEVFHVSTAAVSCFIQKRGTGAFKTGDDEANVVTPGIGFRHDEHSEFPMPRTGLISYLFKDAGFFTGCLVLTAGFLERGVRMGFQDAGGRKTKDIMDIVGGAPCIQFRCRKVRITAYEDTNSRPYIPDALNNPFDDRPCFFAAGPFAGT